MKLTLILAGCLLAAPLAHAHSDKSHAAAKPVAAEQTAWGIAGEAVQAVRTVSIEMTDAMRFTPDKLGVQEGDTVRFVVSNKGRMLHEMVIGTPDALAQHAAMMARFPGMEHDEPYMVHVAPGQRGEMVWRFNRAGTFEFACLIAGHYEAGMRGTVTVTPIQGAAQ